MDKEALKQVGYFWFGLVMVVLAALVVAGIVVSLWILWKPLGIGVIALMVFWFLSWIIYEDSK